MQRLLPTLSPREQEAVRFYDRLAATGDTEDRPMWLDSFTCSVFAHVMRDAELVDIGCRLGRFIPVSEQLGFGRYMGIDPSEASIEYCRKEFPQYEFAVDEIRTIGAHYPGRFGAFVFIATLMLLPRKDLDVALSSLRASLRSGAPGLFSTPVGTGTRPSTWKGTKLTTTLYTESELETAFARNRFHVASLQAAGHMLVGHIIAN